MDYSNVNTADTKISEASSLQRRAVNIHELFRNILSTVFQEFLHKILLYIQIRILNCMKN